MVNIEDDEMLRVKGSTSATALASTLAHGIYEGRPMTMRAIGAAAINQSMKAVAIAQSYVGARGFILYVRPGFTDVQMPDGVVTAMIFHVKAE